MKYLKPSVEDWGAGPHNSVWINYKGDEALEFELCRCFFFPYLSALKNVFVLLESRGILKLSWIVFKTETKECPIL